MFMDGVLFPIENPGDPGKMRIWGLGGLGGVIYILNIIKRIARKLCIIILLYFRTSHFSISLWENPNTPHFHDFGISGRVHDSRNQY